VAALEQHVKLGRECDENAVKGVIGLELEDDRTAENCVAGIHEAGIAVDAFVRVTLLFRVRVWIFGFHGSGGS